MEMILMAKKYLDVYENLKADLYQKYPVGTFLPTEQELMKIYGASRTTIRHAIAMMQEEHLLDVRQGRGTQVLLRYSFKESHQFPMFHNVTDITELLTVDDGQPYQVHGCIIDSIPAPEDVAEQLQVPVGTMIYRLERILHTSGIPFAFFKNYFRCELVPGLEKYSGNEEALRNVYQLFEQEYGIYFGTGKETISARLSSFFDSKLLNMKPGMPMLFLQRTAYTSSHETMEYCERLIRPDMIRFVVSMNGAPHYD